MQSKTKAALFYHNLEHTEGVVKAADMIARHYALGDNDYFILITAAWFHDVGYFDDVIDLHEESGARKAAAFLEVKGVAPKTVEAIKQCILATAFGYQPLNLLEQIIKDADLFHFGTDDFMYRNRMLRKEREALLHQKINKKQFRKETIALLEYHQFYTNYCQAILGSKKEQNIRELKHEVAAKGSDPQEALGDQQPPAKNTSRKHKSERPEKGIETMFRITSNNSQRLSDQADTKANILITVNTIIVSVLLSTVVRNIEQYTNLTIPTIMLLSANLITIVFSILATKPHIPKGTFTQQEVMEKRVNLLFFGNFYQMPFKEYADGMLQMMEDRDFLYLGLIRDVYNQGVVLGKKYRMLKIAYSVFMVGFILSVITFFIASKYYAA
ncbi:Pycsar system effector family protein [Cesiribacter sp. SM1]|uniref:Pycsar system effector family protein n=1 Tax=Cesiribacter sp. SM1 TaxID=2861196 RepID=UPI001CD67CAB|nr:Pycsar system effector family protein [Cesiribacter sp. SM1]